MTINTLAKRALTGGFQSILGQDQSIRILTAFLQKNAIPNGLLFAGINGIGKSSAAAVFAMACNCRCQEAGADYHATAPCGQCRSCRKILSESHPDVIWIKPGGSQRIKIDQIRNLRRILALRPSEARMRVVIIRSAECMNAAAANALLKILEEPPVHTVFILTVRQPADLPPTIVSRCQRLRFVPLADRHIQTLLTTQAGLDDNQAAVITAMAGGSAGRAMALAARDGHIGWAAQRDCLIAACGAGGARLTPAHLLALAQILSEDQDRLADYLDIMQSWFRDVLVYPHLPGSIHHPDRIESLEKAVAGWPVEHVLDKIDLIEQARRAQYTQANARLILEWLLINLNDRK